MATFSHSRIIGLKELNEEDLSGEELDNLKKGESILSCNTFKYSEITDDQRVDANPVLQVGVKSYTLNLYST